MFVALYDFETLRAIEILHLGDGEVAPFSFKPLHQAERLAALPIELRDVPIPSVKATEQVHIRNRILITVLRVQRRYFLGDFLGQQFLYLVPPFRVRGPLKIKPLRAKPRRNEERSREVHGNPHQSEPRGDLYAIPWIPLRSRSEGATREVATGASRPNSI